MPNITSVGKASAATEQEINEITKEILNFPPTDQGQAIQMTQLGILLEIKNLLVTIRQGFEK